MHSKAKPKILLLGTGYTLSRVPAVFEPGLCVATSRDESKVADFITHGVRSVRVDLAEPDTLRSALDQFPSISMVVDSVPPLKSDAPDVLVANAVEVFRDYGKIQRLVYLSTTGVFGEDAGNWVDESSPCNPRHVQSKARLACEERYASLDTTLVVLRLPAIYGPERGLEKSLREGTYRIIDDGQRWTNRIHVDDIVQLLRMLLTRTNSTPPKILCVSDDFPTRQSEVVEDYCRAFSLPYPESRSYDDALARGQFTMLSNQRVKNALLREYMAQALYYPSYRDWLECLFDGNT